VRGDIAFRDVRFRHAGRSAWTLDGVSFSIDAGSTVALVGPSGSGALLAAAAAAPNSVVARCLSDQVSAGFGIQITYAVAEPAPD